MRERQPNNAAQYINMKKIFIATLINFVIVAHALAQSNQPWQGKKCAVVLTYDDAINEHLDNAIPVLDSLGLKATFSFSNISFSFCNKTLSLL